MKRPASLWVVLQEIMKAVITLHLQPLLGRHPEDFVDERDLSYNIAIPLI